MKVSHVSAFGRAARILALAAVTLCTGATALLGQGAVADAPEKSSGQTALMCAVAARHPDVVKTLLEVGVFAAASALVGSQSSIAIASGFASRSRSPTRSSWPRRSATIKSCIVSVPCLKSRSVSTAPAFLSFVSNPSR